MSPRIRLRVLLRILASLRGTAPEGRGSRTRPRLRAIGPRGDKRDDRARSLGGRRRRRAPPPRRAGETAAAAGAGTGERPQRQAAPRDLPEARWARLEPRIPPQPGGPGRPRDVARRAGVNAIRSGLRPGGGGEYLAHALPPGPTVDPDRRRWRDAGG